MTLLVSFALSCAEKSREICPTGFYTLPFIPACVTKLSMTEDRFFNRNPSASSIWVSFFSSVMYFTTPLKELPFVILSIIPYIFYHVIDHAGQIEVFAPCLGISRFICPACNLVQVVPHPRQLADMVIQFGCQPRTDYTPRYRLPDKFAAGNSRRIGFCFERKVFPRVQFHADRVPAFFSQFLGRSSSSFYRIHTFNFLSLFSFQTSGIPSPFLGEQVGFGTTKT